MMSIGYNPFDEDVSLEALQEYRAMAYSLREENLRLKKQVDELKMEKSRAMRGCEWLSDCQSQAVKDTAKEIYREINSCIEQGQEYCGLDWRGLLTAKNVILLWCKKKGVEVE